MSDKLEADEKLVLFSFRRAKKMSHAGIELAVREGVLVKLDVTEKLDVQLAVSTMRLIREDF